MTVEKFELKTFTREEWGAQLEMLDKEYPLVLHTDAGRTFSMVRRMKAEKKMGIPINLRSGFAISIKNGKAANAMTVDKWEEFYSALSERLKGNYPNLYESLFSPNKSSKAQIDVSRRAPGRAWWLLDPNELTGPRATEIVNEYSRNHSDALGLPGANLGGWTNKDENKTYLDVSQNIKDRDAAIIAGKAQNQIAIYDLNNSAEIPTGGADGS